MKLYRGQRLITEVDTAQSRPILGWADAAQRHAFASPRMTGPYNRRRLDQMMPTALVRTNRVVRTAAFAYCIVPIGLYLADRGAGTAAWLLLALQFLAYPQLVYWRAIRSARPARAELDNLFLDAAFLGGWVAYPGFPLWITYALIAAAMLNAAVNRGWQGTVLALVSSAIGAGLWAVVGGL